ncbi:MAG: gp26 family baseplate hub assembly chaperone [Patescibacteria group bacterium]|nr:gp26 family baseplate hub assembly chaperone [Patescibacteria group bacterium]
MNKNILEKVSNHPVVKVELPLSKDTIWVRPYLVKEQKILQTIAESDDAAEIGKNLQLLVHSCIINPENYNVEDMPLFDLQYMLIKLREISVGNEVQQAYVCRAKHDGKVCGGDITVKYKLSDVVCENLPNPSEEDNLRNIMISDNLGVRVKWPKVFDKMKFSYENPEDILTMISYHIEYIFDENGNYQMTPEEYYSFLENLKIDDFKKIFKFFEENSQPRMVIYAPYSCPKCGNNGTLTLSTITDFFTF